MSSSSSSPAPSPSRHLINSRAQESTHSSSIEAFPNYPADLPADEALISATLSGPVDFPAAVPDVTAPNSPVELPAGEVKRPVELPANARRTAASTAKYSRSAPSTSPTTTTHYVIGSPQVGPSTNTAAGPTSPSRTTTAAAATTPTSPYIIRRRPIGIRRLPSSVRRRAPSADGYSSGSAASPTPSLSGSTGAPSANGLQSPQFSLPTSPAQGHGVYDRLSRPSMRQSAQQQPELPSLYEDLTLPQQQSPNLPHRFTISTPQARPTSAATATTAANTANLSSENTPQRMRSWSSAAARSLANRISGGSFGEELGSPSHADGYTSGCASPTRSPDYESEVVDLLDVIDPEVSALTTLTNVQNSLFVPDLGRWVNRRPTYTLSRPPQAQSPRPYSLAHMTEDSEARAGAGAGAGAGALAGALAGAEDATDSGTEAVEQQAPEDQAPSRLHPSMKKAYSWQNLPRPTRQRTHSISSELTDSHYAVLPHGLSLDDWSEEDKEVLDDYVRHMLHSKRSKFKQTMKAFGKYMSTPLGFVVTLYATLITLFGLAWVLFLIGWIYVGSRKSYVVNVVDNVLVALFALVGDGMAPFRAVDTYHMIYIAHYHRLSWKLRRQRHLPALKNHNDLPQRFEKDTDLEAATTTRVGRVAAAAISEADATGANQEDIDDAAEFIVLTPAQQNKLIHHQSKFSKSHTYYKPHETVTHHAFPVKLLIAVVVLLDCHSTLQIMLGTFTWAWSYHTRPEWITSVILSLSITVNISAGVLISIGDRRTRKKDVIERMSRQNITQEAIKKVQKVKQKGQAHQHQNGNGNGHDDGHDDGHGLGLSGSKHDHNTHDHNT